MLLPEPNGEATTLMFNTARAAQIAAFFAHKQGGVINVMKLVKLMYLADREALDQLGEPLTYDRMVSLDNGPILSQTLNLINGDFDPSILATWEEWISDRANHDVRLKRHVSREQLDQLSNMDLEILETTWAKFGSMNQWMLSKFTHEHCKEWVDPEGSSRQISELDVLLALGRPRDQAEALAKKIRAERDIDALFTQL